MGCSYLTKSIRIFAVSSILALGVFSAPSYANDTTADLRQGLPGRRISGGSRSPDTACVLTQNDPVIALIPKNNVGTTLSTHPTFWFSLPAVNPDRTLEFGLFNQEGDLVYQTMLDAPAEAGLTKVSLPETESSLLADRNYRWYLSVVCNRESRAEDLVVTGWVRRIEAESTLLTQLEESTPQERFDLYKEVGLWYEALAVLSDMRQRDPNAPESAQQWNSLMQTLDLPQLVSAPFGSRLDLGAT